MATGTLDSLLERSDRFLTTLQKLQSGWHTVLPESDSYSSPRRTAFGMTFDSRLETEHERTEMQCGGGYSLAFFRLKKSLF